jgi:hypothetical protein
MKGFAEQQIVTTEELKESVSLSAVLAAWGVEIKPNDKFTCIYPNHLDQKTPSSHLYDADDSFYCFGCQTAGDIFSVVMERGGMDFPSAKRWLEEFNGEPISQRKTTKKESKPKQKLAVPQHWIMSWCINLQNGNRGWLNKERLLTDATIDFTRLGWREDYKAYAIPYWRGRPGKSEVEVVQYRSTPQSPLFHGRTWHYIGESGFYHSAILNRYLINRAYVVIFFGTFDAILAAQDGIPAIGTNGSTAFGKDTEATRWLQKELANTKQIFIVPDKTPIEAVHATRLAEAVGGEVRYFPLGDWGKDYTDYRNAGYTGTNFLEEILKMDVIFPAHRETFSDILLLVSQGKISEIYELLAIVCEYAKALNRPFGAVSYDLQVAATMRDFETDVEYIETLLPQEWDFLATDISNAKGDADTIDVLAKWAAYAADRYEESLHNQGGF